MQSLAVEGSSDLASAVQIAQLALKHRQNKNQRQRIVLFVGSPVAVSKVTSLLPCNHTSVARPIAADRGSLHTDSLSSRPLQESLLKIARKLKKNNVAVDIVSFGNEEENTEKLEAFIEAVNSGDNSHIVSVPAGTILADSLFGTSIFQARSVLEPACLFTVPAKAAAWLSCR